MRRLPTDERGGSSLAQAAIVTPIIVMVALALVNMAVAGFAAVWANNAANFGARMGAVTQGDAAQAAVVAAWQSLSAAPVGTYHVDIVSPGGVPGSTLGVRVRWEVPNWFGGIAAAFYDTPNPPTWHGEATAFFRQEGW